MAIQIKKSTPRLIRQSVSLPAPIAKRVKALAERRKLSATKVVAELIETGLESAENERRRFFELTDKLIQSKDTGERSRIKSALAQMTFGS